MPDKPEAHESSTMEEPSQETGEHTKAPVNDSQAKSSKLKGLFTKLRQDKKLLTIAALAFVVAVGGTVFVLAGGSDKPEQTNQTSNQVEAAKISATIRYFEGKIERKNGEFFTPLAVDDTLQEGDVVRTSGVSSRATIALENGSFIRLNADTEITLTALREDEVVILQEGGQVYSRVSPSSNATHIVETNQGTYQALGTAFKTTSSGDEESVEVYDSKVEETQGNKTISEGEKLYLKNVPDTSKEGQTLPLDIEAVKADVFTKWCRDEDEKIAEFKDKLGFLSDVSGPELSLASPANGSTITVDTNASSGSVSFKGKTEAGVILTIRSTSLSDSAPVAVTVGGDGSFESEAIKGIIGTSKFEIISKDTAGNKTVLNWSVIFKKKVVSGPITLTNKGAVEGKYRLSWSVGSGYSTDEGFKIVWGESPDPTYPGASHKVFAEGDERQADIDLGKKYGASTTYYIRICRLTDGACDVYSYQITITVPPKD